MRRPVFLTVLASLICLPSALRARERSIGVFVALCDNERQGIVPVPKAIGDGDDPETNLYWGAGEGLKTVFDRSKVWKLTEKADSPQSADILRTRTYRHGKSNATLHARAYRGSAIKQCIQDFETAVQLGTYDLVVFIGHNGLMDFDLPGPKRSASAVEKRAVDPSRDREGADAAEDHNRSFTVAAGNLHGRGSEHASRSHPDRQGKVPDCIVLCCKSEKYFRARLLAAGGRPVLLTTQFMYPGSFILHAVLDDWFAGAGLGKLRETAGAAYAQNQKISRKAGLGIFADLATEAATRPSTVPAPIRR